MSDDAYEDLAVGYAKARRADPRIAAKIEAALGGARSVVNVGAGLPVPNTVMTALWSPDHAATSQGVLVAELCGTKPQPDVEFGIVDETLR